MPKIHSPVYHNTNDYILVHTIFLFITNYTYEIPRDGGRPSPRESDRLKVTWIKYILVPTLPSLMMRSPSIMKLSGVRVHICVYVSKSPYWEIYCSLVIITETIITIRIIIIITIIFIIIIIASPGWKTSYCSLVTTAETKEDSALAKKGTDATRARQLKLITSWWWWRWWGWWLRWRWWRWWWWWRLNKK